MSPVPSRINEVNNRLFLRIHQAGNLVHKKGSAALEELGVTTQQWAVLASLSRPQVKNGMTVNEIGEYHRVSRQNISPMLRRLEKLGYIKRFRDVVDQRSRRITLTRSGRALLDRIAPVIQAVYNELLEGVPRDDQISLIHYLNRLLKNM